MAFEHMDAGALEPRLVAAVGRQRNGSAEVSTSSTDGEQVAIFAEVNDLDKWKQRGDVLHGATLSNRAGKWLVTARVARERLTAIAASQEVISLSSGVRLRPNLWATTEDIGATPATLNGTGKGGEGVLVGIIDYGCDFVHRNFRHASGATRVEAIWDQSGDPGPESPFGYGRLYTKEQIDAALRESDPYAALGYGPAPDSAYSSGAHGTHVMDIAAGNGLGSGKPGVAPDADLAFVHIDSNVPWTGPDVVGSYFGDSVNLAEAVSWLFELAGDRPCVINISLGTNGGPHDGTSLVERWLDGAVSDAPGRAVVIAASNSQADGIHSMGVVQQDSPFDLLWHMESGDFTHNELEIWYSGEAELEAEIITPDGTSIGSISLGESGRVMDPNHDAKVLFYISHVQAPNGDNTIGIFMEPELPTGGWTIRLKNMRSEDVAFHAWIERDDRGQSSFGDAQVETHTIGSIATGQNSIVVGSYNARSEVKALSYFSSAGPTRDGRQKPELSAPGHGVWAAHSRTTDGLTRKSGTSMAAPAVTGVAALLLAEATRQQQQLDVQQLREILIDSGRRAGADDWHNRYGHGRVDAEAALTRLLMLLAPQQAPAPEAAPAGDGRPRMKIGPREGLLLESVPEAGLVEGIIELSDPQEVPDFVAVRAQQDNLVTGSFPASKLESLINDTRVKRVEVSRSLRLQPNAPPPGAG